VVSHDAYRGNSRVHWHAASFEDMIENELLLRSRRSALIRQVALVSLTDMVSPATVMQISAALQKQATRDLGPIWDVSATVDAFQQLVQVPVGTWPIIIGGRVPPGAGGFHTDQNGQPLAFVRASADINVLSQTCSHEMIEMLVDPFGSRFVPGDSPMPDQGRVNFLLEACDPSEGAQFGYTVNNLLVSDFYRPTTLIRCNRTA